MRREAFHPLLLLALCLPLGSAQAFLSLVRQGAESAEVPNANDRFGRAVCAGDFDGDGYDDLAAAAPDESNGLINTAVHGLVVISRGSARGISTEGAKTIDVGDLGTEAARFGWSLVAADFDQDDYDDLAVGIPMLDNLGGVDRGSVWIYRGGPGGLQVAPYLQIFYDDVALAPSNGALFGWALSSGDFDDDGYPDLVTSAIGDEADTGALYFFFGGNGGLSTQGLQRLYPFTAGGSAALGSWFGYSLQAGQFDGVGGDDLAVGAPKTDVLGVVDSGRVYILRANATGISATGAWFLDRSTMGAVTPTGDAELGFSLAAGNFFQPNGPWDLAMGAPQDDYGQQLAAGAVFVVDFNGNASGYDSIRLLRQHAISNSTSASPNDQFGYALAAGKFDIGNYHDLAIGAPFENVTEQSALGEQADAGIFHVVYGKDGGPSMTGCETFNAVRLNNYVDAGELLGQALCFGSFDNSGRQAVAVGAPNAEYESYEWGGIDVQNAGRVHIVAPWRQPQNHPHRSSVLLDCDGYIVYGQRPFVRVRPASTTKTMTLLLACEAIQDGEVDPDHWYKVPSWVADSVGGSQTPLVDGEWLKFVGLMQTMMTVSGNDSAMLIGSILSGEGGSWEGWEDTSPSFAAAMEAKASQLGLSGATSLTNAAGIDAGDHYVTALDWAKLAFLAIQNDCVKTIVNQTNWIVERILPDGASLNFFAVDGEGSGDIHVFENFFAGWVDGVKDRYSGAVGIKPGSTPGAWVTGLSAGDPGPFQSGHTAASSFGTRKDDTPAEGVSGGCSECLHADLLDFGEGFCSGGPADDFAPTPDPGPQPWGTLTNVPPCPEEGVHGLSFNLADDQAVAPGRIVQFDLMRSGHGSPQAPVRQMLTRSTQLAMTLGDPVNFGIAPHQSNLGLRLRNEGETPATLILNWNGSIQTYSLAPGAMVQVPGVDAPSSSFQFWMEVLDRDATIAVEELGYAYEHVLLDGISGPDAVSLQLTRDGEILAENFSVQLRGTGDDCDDDGFDLVARADDDVPTGIDGEPEFLPAAPAALRLLPNYPNPFNPSTTLRFDLPRAATVELAIFDLRGRKVRNLASGVGFEAGRHELRWDGVDDAGASVASGVYLLKLDADGQSETRRLTLLK